VSAAIFKYIIITIGNLFFTSNKVDGFELIFDKIIAYIIYLVIGI